MLSSQQIHKTEHVVADVCVLHLSCTKQIQGGVTENLSLSAPQRGLSAYHSIDTDYPVGSLIYQHREEGCPHHQNTTSVFGSAVLACNGSENLFVSLTCCRY